MESNRTRANRRRWIGAFVIAALALGLGGVVAQFEDRYGPVDPTDPGWKTTVINDTGQRIHVTSPGEDLPIAAGQSDVVVNPVPGDLEARYFIVSDQGGTLGCLQVSLSRRSTIAVRASSMRPCDAK